MSVCVAGSLLLESLGGVTVPSWVWVAVCVTAFRLPCEGGEDVPLAGTVAALRPGLFSMLILRVGGDGVVAAGWEVGTRYGVILGWLGTSGSSLALEWSAEDL